MKSAPDAAPAKPAASRIEAKNELTTKAARSIIDGEVAKRVAKTDRLRALRLEQEAVAAAAAAAEPKKPAKKARKAHRQGLIEAPAGPRPAAPLA